MGIAMGIDEKSLGIQRLLRWRLPEREPVTVGAPAAGDPGSEEGGGDA
jgi:hypothetical protein